MASQYNGNSCAIATRYSTQASNREGPPAAPVSIASSTFATPTVVTTSSAHGLSENDWIYIEGHATNTSVNGFRKAHIVDATHVALYTNSGVAIAGIAIGGATGTIQSTAMGSTFAIPADGDDFTAAAFNTAYEALADRTAYLERLAGWTGTLYPGSTLPQRAIDTTTLHDADATVDVSQDIWSCDVTIAGTPAWTLRSTTTPKPAKGNEITLTRAGGGSGQANIQREGGSPIVSFLDQTSAAWASATFYWDGTKWRLRHVSGNAALAGSGL